MSKFWDNIDSQLGQIRNEKINTVDGIIEALGGSGNASAGDAFFAGSGGDDQLVDALRDAGWKISYKEGDYWFEAASTSGEKLEYIEGDVYELVTEEVQE